MGRSLVWEYFTVDCNNEASAKCNLCQKSISRGGKIRINFSTSGLRDHLKGNHKKEYQAMLDKEKGKFRHSTGPSQLISLIVGHNSITSCGNCTMTLTS